MSLLDSLTGKKEQEKLRKEIASLKIELKQSKFAREDAEKKNIQILDHTHSFLERLKLLVGTLEYEFILERTWDLIDMTFKIKRGGVFKKSPEGWIPIFSVGFKEDDVPIIPLAEESIVTFSAKHHTPLSLAHLRRQDDLAYLERRGALPDAKIACPVMVQGEIALIVVICQFAGNVFQGEDDIEILEMITTILGLVLTNADILKKQKITIDKQTIDFNRLRQLFSSMVAPEVIQYIEQNPGGIVLGGKRQIVAVMFADIRGFTRMSENRDPEVVIELLNKFFTRLTDIVIKEKGTLDKFMGDAAMALFGTPIPLENPCISAVTAAENIQAMIQGSMAEWVGDGFPAFSVGIGISYQEVVVGNVGSERLSNFTAIGDGVNVAFRLCSIAKGGEILVTAGVQDNIEAWVGRSEERSGIAIKGKKNSITVFALTQFESYEAGPCPKCGVFLEEGTFGLSGCLSCCLKQFVFTCGLTIIFCTYK